MMGDAAIFAGAAASAPENPNRLQAGRFEPAFRAGKRNALPAEQIDQPPVTGAGGDAAAVPCGFFSTR